MIKKLLLAAAGSCIAVTAFAGKPMRFDTHLEGYNAGGVPVPTSATGQARVEVIDGGTALYFQIEVAGVRNLLMAHIHVAPAPVQVTDPAGPVAFWFTGGPPPAATVKETINGSFARGYVVTDGQVSNMTVAELIAAIQEGRASVVIHTDDLDPNTPTGTQGDSRGGELRGTLR